MYKRNREINVFNMSALDLFASALGAFILLTLMLLPYYLKTDETLKKQLKQQEQQLEIQKNQLDAQQKQNKSLQKELDNTVQMALLGITTKAKSFVILVDMSGSMKNYSHIMVRTLKDLLQPMQSDKKIQVIGFHGDNLVKHDWQTPYFLTNMTDVNRTLALNFISRLTNQFLGGTPTHQALLEALSYHSEAIILLTDGRPNNHLQTNYIIADITRKNAGKKEIHTVALGNYRSDPILVAFLEALSKQNKGGFVGVAN